MAVGIMHILKSAYSGLKTDEIVIPLAATIISVMTAWLLVRNAFTVMAGDAVAYWDMAQVPISPDNQWWWGNVPYTYRIAIPFIVRNVFNSSMVGYIFITILSLLVSNYLVYKISQLYTRNRIVSSLIVIIFTTNFTIFNPIVNPALVDMPSFVFILLITFIFLKYIIVKTSTTYYIWLIFAIALAMAVLIKEWILFVLPVLFIYLLLTRKVRKAALLFAFSMPAAGLHLGIRLIMGPLLPGIQSPSIALLIERYLTDIGAYRSLFATFGAIWLVIPFALTNVWRSNRESIEMYILPILAMLVFLPMGTIASDHNRYLFFISFPFLIPALSIYFDKYNAFFKKLTLYAIIILFLMVRLAMNYRPADQQGFAPTSGQSETVILLISIMAVLQILLMFYYIIGAHTKWRLPGNRQIRASLPGF
jgi:hypothetical protein